MGWLREQRSVRVWADGVMWASQAEYNRARKLAVGITGADIMLIGKLVRHTEDAARRGRPDMVTGSHWDKERKRQEMVRGLYERAGAATAREGDPQVVPLTLVEIEQVKQIRYDIQYFTGYYLHERRDPMLDAADDLLNRLHMLLGHARATGDAGGVAVFRADPRRQSGLRAVTNA